MKHSEVIQAMLNGEEVQFSLNNLDWLTPNVHNGVLHINPMGSPELYWRVKPLLDFYYHVYIGISGFEVNEVSTKNHLFDDNSGFYQSMQKMGNWFTDKAHAQRIADRLNEVFKEEL